MKSYKLNKTLENSTYPIEQELKNLNQLTQKSSLNAISITTVIFSGIATSLIIENKLFENKVRQIIDWLKKYNIIISNEQLFFYAILLIYVVFFGWNLIVYFKNKYKLQPQNMKKSKYGREKLSENFHKSIINDIVVGLSFVDKADEVIKQEIVEKTKKVNLQEVVDESSKEREEEVKNMYLYEATYYFLQASNQIEQMKIFDDEKEICNHKLIDEIGHNTLLTTLKVFKNGVEAVVNKLPKTSGNANNESVKKENQVEHEVLEEILAKLQIHINLLK